MINELKNNMEQTLVIAEKYEFKALNDEIKCLFSEIEDFKLKVIFVGSFSAGKSALINSMLGRELLEEGQRPETAIASELVYSDEEHIEAIKDNECMDKFLFEESNDIDIDKYDYLIWHINSDVLKEFNDCTIVDFPGFNSGIKEHNKAIIQYACKGNAYVFVIDCEDGTIKPSITKFVEEIKNYDDNMAIVVSKTDLKTEADAKKIVENVENNSAMIFGKTIDVVATSKFDEFVSQKIKKVISGFDRDSIFRQTFYPHGYEIAYKCINSLETYRDGLKLDLSEFDEEISKHELCKKQLSEKLEKDKLALEKKLKNQVAPAILSDVQNALYNNVDTLANAVSGGEKTFSLAINNILRPVLMESTNSYVEKSFSEFVADIGMDCSDIDETVRGISQDAVGKYQQASEKIQEIAKTGEKMNAAYKAITTTLAVATSVVAPWLELVLIFLPDILKLLGVGKQEVSIKNKVNNEIIPQIINRIQPEIEKSLADMKDEMVAELVENINQLLDIEVESLEKAKELKAQKLVQYDEEIEKINADIELINKVIESLA